ncbi:alpha/beta hydrolase [Paenibacillus harenae]|uniref:alpha/beta hydrolase n=1 Tax=Paenibacillus harenae TaxID=306543 RepID=UPI0027D82B2A|nr:alpha/beta hydrolase [Paenibacillus harenae]
MAGRIRRSIGDENQGCPSLNVYPVHGEGPCPAVIVCPGGRYLRRAAHEGEPVAKWLNGLGITAFVLNYRVSPHQHPIPLQDAKRAIRTVRHYAEDWNIDPERVGMLGLSAGGHLASATGTLYDNGDNLSSDPIERQSSRPNLLILCYPVITFGAYGHQPSMRHLLGDSPDESLVALLSTETQVAEDSIRRLPDWLCRERSFGAMPPGS